MIVQSVGLPVRAGRGSAVPRIAMPALPQACSGNNAVNSTPCSIVSGTRFNTVQ